MSPEPNIFDVCLNTRLSCRRRYILLKNVQLVIGISRKKYIVGIMSINQTIIKSVCICLRNKVVKRNKIYGLRGIQSETKGNNR